MAGFLPSWSFPNFPFFKRRRLDTGGDVDTLSVPCLGRPFELGTLYDCTQDHVIIGPTLWDQEDLENHIVSKDNDKTTFAVLTEDNFEKKAEALDVKGSLKLSLLGGLVNVEGSGKYLRDRKQSSSTERVSLQFSCQTTHSHLTMKHLGPGQTKYNDTVKNSSATHVVTGIQYGGNAFLTFDLQTNETKSKTDAGGFLKGVIEKIPKFSAEGNLDLKFESNEKELVKQLDCKFFGDVSLDKSPTEFSEAVHLYQQLPSMIKEKPVPVTVYLYPLEKLDGKAIKLVKEVSENFIHNVSEIMEGLQIVKEECQTIAETIRSNNQSLLLSRGVEQFVKHIKEYEINLKKALIDKIPEIRRGRLEEQPLADLISDYYKSPFNLDSLKKWIRLKNEEVKHLNTFTSQFSEDTICVFTDGSALYELTTKQKDLIVCTLEFCRADDKQLQLMEDYEWEPNTKVSQEGNFVDTPWFKSKPVITQLGKVARDLISYKSLKSNKDVHCAAFLISECDVSAVEFKSISLVVYKDHQEVTQNFIPPSKPGSPTASDENCKATKIILDWSKPKSGAEYVTHYKVFYKEVASSEWVIVTTCNSERQFMVEKLKPGTAYVFKIQPICEVGCGPESEVSDEITTEKYNDTIVSEMVKELSELINEQNEPGSPEVYRPPMKLLTRDKTSLTRHFRLFESKTMYYPKKVLMVVGATGSGKSTFINGLANYILGVKWEDTFRFKVVTSADEETKHAGNQAFSQTEYITAYWFGYQKGMPGNIKNYELVIIDTPGYGDCRGIERDKLITEQIRNFFSKEHGRWHVDHLDAVCFITQSPGRLTHTQSYIINSILSLFAKDIADNILLLITFADAKRPPVLDSIEKAKVPYKQFFKFNNSALFAQNTSDDGTGIDKMFWQMGYHSMEKFCDALNKMEPKSLTLTREVLRERQKLEASVEGLQPQIKKVISELKNLEKEKEVLEKYKRQIKDNENFQITVPEDRIITVNKPPGLHVTVCLECSFNCHDNCSRKDNDEKSKCCVMTDGNCTVCPNKCHWTKHNNTPFVYKVEQINVTKTLEQLKKQYELGRDGKQNQEKLVKQMEKKSESLKGKALGLVEKVKNCLYRLGEIAFRPNPLSTTDYIDLLVETETREANRGWEERVKQLHAVKEHAILCEKIAKNENVLKT